MKRKNPNSYQRLSELCLNKKHVSILRNHENHGNHENHEMTFLKATP